MVLFHSEKNASHPVGAQNMPAETTVKSMKQREMIVVLFRLFPATAWWPKYLDGKKQCEDIHCQVDSQRHTPPLAQGTA